MRRNISRIKNIEPRRADRCRCMHVVRRHSPRADLYMHTQRATRGMQPQESEKKKEAKRHVVKGARAVSLRRIVREPRSWRSRPRLGDTFREGCGEREKRWLNRAEISFPRLKRMFYIPVRVFFFHGATDRGFTLGRARGLCDSICIGCCFMGVSLWFVRRDNRLLGGLKFLRGEVYHCVGSCGTGMNSRLK